MPRNPGKLDRRITFKALTVTRGAAGGVVETYAELATNPTVWAEKIEQGTREFRAAGALHEEATFLFRIRYRSDITAKHRITYGSDTFEIVGRPVEEGRGEFLVIPAKHTEGRA